MRDEDTLEGNDFQFHLGSLALLAGKLDAPGAGIPRTARVLHEYDHLVRLLGTSYGLVRHGLLSQYLHYFLQAFEQAGDLATFRSRWNEVRSGTDGKLGADRFDSMYFRDESSRNLFRAQACLDGVGILDGKALGAVGVGALASWGEYCEGLLGNSPIQNDALLARLRQLWGAVPRDRKPSLIYIDGVPLRVHDILEYLGVVVELGYRVQYGEGLGEFPSDLSERVYLQILNVIKTYVPKAIDDVRMAHEVEALLELALWVPLWPSMSEIDLPEHGTHLLPSYRLQLLLDAAKELDLPFSFDDRTDVEEISPRAREFQEAICNHLKWPSPATIAKHWATGLTAIEANASDDWTKVFFHHPRSRRLAWSKQLIVECGEHPVSGPMLAGARHFGTIGFPTILDHSQFQRGFIRNGEVAWPEADRDFQRMDVLLITGATYAPFPRDWKWLPPVVQQEAVETWLRTPPARD